MFRQSREYIKVIILISSDVDRKKNEHRKQISFWRAPAAFPRTNKKKKKGSLNGHSGKARKKTFVGDAIVLISSEIIIFFLFSRCF